MASRLALLPVPWLEWHSISGSCSRAPGISLLWGSVPQCVVSTLVSGARTLAVVLFCESEASPGRNCQSSFPHTKQRELNLRQVSNHFSAKNFGLLYSWVSQHQWSHPRNKGNLPVYVILVSVLFPLTTLFSSNHIQRESWSFIPVVRKCVLCHAYPNEQTELPYVFLPRPAWGQS